MSVVVQFDYTQWSALFPQFGALTEAQVTEVILPLAEGYHRNDGDGPVVLASMQSSLLNLMVAHVAQLLFGADGSGGGGTGTVGRVSSASEGSVSVGTEFPVTPGSAWFLQTQWGAMYWQLAAPYRTMRYVSGPRRNFNPWPLLRLR